MPADIDHPGKALFRESDPLIPHQHAFRFETKLKIIIRWFVLCI